MVRNLVYLLITVLVAISATAQTKKENVLLLSGEWNFRFDPQNVGINQRWYKTLPFDDTIILPGTTDEQAKGNPEPPELGRFTRIHAYRGAAWYQTEVEIPKHFEGKRLVLSMERTKVTKYGLMVNLLGKITRLLPCNALNLHQLLLRESTLSR